VNAIIKDRITSRKRRLEKRLDENDFSQDRSRPMLGGTGVRFELSGRACGTAYGGLGLIRQLVDRLKLAGRIDERLHLFKRHLPYHESDHVLNLAYNALCAGTCLEDLELRRQDEAYLNLLDAERIPDPTTSGDFCRRFRRHDLRALQAAYDEARKQVWSEQPEEFFAEARIEADGTLVATDAECKEGIDYCAYKSVWGYHPLVVTLANTGEVLRLLNRSGNRPSHEGAAPLLDERIALCREAGFKKILLRGDTDFSQITHLDRWHEQGDLEFVFGYDATAQLHILADDLTVEAWKPLQRPPKHPIRAERRSKPARIKQAVVEARGFKDVRLVDEWVAEFDYRPHACRRTYRLVVVRKNLRVSEPKQDRLFGQRPLSAGKRDRAVERITSPARAGQRPLIQRGLHARHGLGLEPQGLVGAVARRASREIRAARTIESTAARPGVPDVRELLPPSAGAGRENRPADHRATARLQPMAVRVLSPRRNVRSSSALLNQRPAGVVRPIHPQAFIPRNEKIRRNAAPRNEPPHDRPTSRSPKSSATRRTARSAPAHFGRSAANTDGRHTLV
jgi:hypothetical protein